jgi:hypothetical protein
VMRVPGVGATGVPVPVAPAAAPPVPVVPALVCEFPLMLKDRAESKIMYLSFISSSPFLVPDLP